MIYCLSNTVKKGLILLAGRRSLGLAVKSLVVVVPDTIAMRISTIFAVIRIVKFMFLEVLTGRVRLYANMSKTKYSPFEEINELQTEIMVFVDHWVRTVNTPVPRQEIMKAFTDKKKKDHHPAISIEGAINALLRKGYVRKAYSGTNKTYYVQLRGV